MMKSTVLSVIALALVLLLGQQVVADTSQSPYGINAHNEAGTSLQKAADANIDWLRMDFHWKDMEPAQDVFIWNSTDGSVNDAAAKGYSQRILGNLSGPPTWVRRDVDTDLPGDVNDWVDFVTQTVNRYKDHVKAWGIWNEPHIQSASPPSEQTMTKQEYINILLIPAYNAIKAADPTARVSAPELDEWQGGGTGMIQQILNDAADYIDIVSFHCYPHPGLPARTVVGVLDGNDDYLGGPSIHSIMDNYPDKEFWLTESGYTNTFGDSVSEQDQANALTGIYDAMKTRIDWWHKTFWYELKDDPRPEIPQHGLLYDGLSEKPAYTAYSNFIANNPWPWNGEEAAAEFPRPLLEYLFNETGSNAFNTGSDYDWDNRLTMVEVPCGAISVPGDVDDMHTTAGGGVSGKFDDRAFDMFNNATGMGFDDGATKTGGRANAQGGARPPDSVNQLMSFTISMWWYGDGIAPAYGAHLLDLATFDGTEGISLRAEGSGGGGLQLTVDGVSTFASTPDAWPESDEWVFGAVSYDGTQTSNNVRFYKGTKTTSVVEIGVPVTLNSGQVENIADTSEWLTIANKGTHCLWPLDAYIDNVRIWGSKTDDSGLMSLDDLEAVRSTDVEGPAGALACKNGLYLPGDFNKDCRVNFEDYVELASLWMQCSDPDNLDCEL